MLALLIDVFIVMALVIAMKRWCVTNIYVVDWFSFYSLFCPVHSSPESASASFNTSFRFSVFLCFHLFKIFKLAKQECNNTTIHPKYSTWNPCPFIYLHHWRHCKRPPRSIIRRKCYHGNKIWRKYYLGSCMINKLLKISS